MYVSKGVVGGNKPQPRSPLRHEARVWRAQTWRMAPRTRTVCSYEAPVFADVVVAKGRASWHHRASDALHMRRDPTSVPDRISACACPHFKPLLLSRVIFLFCSHLYGS